MEGCIPSSNAIEEAKIIFSRLYLPFNSELISKEQLPETIVPVILS